LADATDSSIFVVGQPLVAALDHAALDLIDRHLISVAPSSLLSMESKGGDAPWKLESKDGVWQVTESPAGKFAADGPTASGATRPWANLNAQRFAAYGPKVDLAKFGLDKPSRS